MGERDPGMFCVSGKLNNGVAVEEAEKAIWRELEKVKTDVSEPEVEKIRNQVLSSQEFGQMNILNKAMGLAYHEILGDADKINTEVDDYMKVTANDIMEIANSHIKPTNCSTLIYHRNNG